jgi:hypothetical protein
MSMQDKVKIELTQLQLFYLCKALQESRIYAARPVHLDIVKQWQTSLPEGQSLSKTITDVFIMR